MSGYSGYSKSNNAVAAEAEDRYPASMLDRLLGLRAGAVAANLRTAEWHHSSKAHNRVAYYDGAALLHLHCMGEAPADMDATDAAELRATYDALRAWRPAKAVEIRHEGCTARWVEWSGTLRRPKATERSAADITITLKGEFATLHLPGGELRKKRSTRGFAAHSADGRLLAGGY